MPRGVCHARLVIAALFAFVGPTLAAEEPRLPGEPSPYVRTLRSDDAGVELEVRVPRSALELRDDGDGRLAVSVAGLRNASRAGSPELPALVLRVAVPAGRGVRVTHEERVLALPAAAPLPPIAALEPSTPWPERSHEVEIVEVRGLAVARVVVYPVRLFPAGQELWFTERLRLRFDFEPAPLVAEFSEFGGSTTAGGVAAMKIAVDAEGWVRVTQAELGAAGFDVGSVDPRNLTLSYRGAPVPLRVVGEADGSFDPGDAVEFFGFPNTGRFSFESVYWLEDAGQPGLRLPVRDATPGSATQVSVFQDSMHFEEASTVYTFGNPAREGDPHFYWVWFEDNPNPPRVNTFTHYATLPGLSGSPGTARFRALFFGRTDPAANPDHRVRFFVNGTQVGESVWNGTTFHTAEVPFDASLLVAGTNAFRVDRQSIALPDIHYMDWIEIDYPRSTSAVADRLLIRREADGSARRYSVSGLSSVAAALVLDVSNPLAPVELTGAVASGSGPHALTFEDSAPDATRYLVVGDAGRISPARLTLDVPSDLRGAQNGADLIVIVPEGWEDALEPLAAARRARGLRVAVAGLTDVADEFAGGNVDDAAVRAFVAHAYASWQAPPVSSLLLVGEPNLDARNEIGSPTFHHSMPTHPGVTTGWGETMSDTWFGAVAGGDLVPDVAVGRLPARSEAEAAAVAAKLLAHEQDSPMPAASAATNVVLVASAAAGFETALESSAAVLPAHFTVDAQYRRAGASASSIVGALDAGAAVASFLGHGNVPFWADNPGGPFFDGADVGLLDNDRPLPFVSALNCLNGLVGHPNFVDSLAEAFVDRPSGGALAMWAPTAIGYLGEYEALQDNLYRAVFEDRELEVGAAVHSALVETFLTEPVSVDLLKSMVLIGDPTSRIAADLDGDAAIDFLELDGGADPADLDSDDDGVADGLEGGLTQDADGDGLVNAADPDADSDALPDGLEAGVSAPGADTDTSRGSFRADADPSSVTDPTDPDSDGGGAPDGAEDRNANGRLDAGENDPRFGSDDPACSPASPPEIAGIPADRIRVAKSGSNLILSWGAAADLRPCLLYRVYAAEIPLPASKDDFVLLGVTGQPTFEHVGALASPSSWRYVVAGHEPIGGEGPWGHFD